VAGPSELLSFAARRLIQYESRFARAELPRRRGASQLFLQIAASLQSLAKDLSRDSVPHDPCRELVLYSTKLAHAVVEELGLQEAEKLSSSLSQGSDQEKLFLEFRTSDRRKELVEELEKAAILIQALANGIYMTSAGEEQAGGEQALRSA
jgi:hypothetical protein